MSEKKDKGLSEQTPDFTGSITETDTENPGASSEKKADKLVGGRPLVRSNEIRALLRFPEGFLRADLAEFLHQTQITAPRRSEDYPVPLVVGPFSLHVVKEAAQQGLLGAQDCILSGFGRWKFARDLFPEHIDPTPTDEVTSTSTSTIPELSEELTATEPSHLELPSVEDAPSSKPKNEKTASGQESPTVTDSPTSRSELSFPPLELEGEVQGASIENPVAPRAKERVQTAKPTATSVSVQPVPSDKVSSTAKWMPAVSVVAALAAGYYLSQFRSASKEIKVSVPAARPVAIAPECPPSLRPQLVESLYASDSALVAKIRPILRSYENGTLVLSSSDEKILREVADPGSASFEARRLAANQLAVFDLANSRIDDARRTLKPILESGTSDPVTLLNVALLQVGNGEYEEARESAATALRLMSSSSTLPSSMSWIAYSVMGLVDGSRGRLDLAENNFRDALRHSPNNPFVYGFFIRTLADHPSERDKIPPLVREALWADPDRLLDSPIRAPLAGHVLMSFAFEGLSKGAELRESRLSAGKRAFVHWLESRYRRNPVSQPIAHVTELLGREDDLQSQMLNAYVLRQQGRFEEASQILTKILPLLQGLDELKSSWPWSFAGDVQFARKNVSQAILFYQNALSRNERDIVAVFGMALVFRESGNYKEAEQKLAETLALDPLFVPALLRVPRFEWHGGLPGAERPAQ